MLLSIMSVYAELTLQLLSSSAVKMMVPHFFPGIPLEGTKIEKEQEQLLIREKVNSIKEQSVPLRV